MFEPAENPAFSVNRDTRNRRLEHGHEPKKRENYIEEMERLQKKSDRVQSQVDSIQQRIDAFPEEDLSKDEAHKKKGLEQKLSHLNKVEHRSQEALGVFEHKLAHTNVKEGQVQIKHGKHKNVGGYGTKNDDPLA